MIRRGLGRGAVAVALMGACVVVPGAASAAPAVVAPAAVYLGASPTGDRVWFRTTEAIPGTGDTDTADDIYERLADNTLRLISTGGANLAVTFVKASRDGTRVWFETAEAIPGTGDADTAVDLYERAADGTLRLLSGGVGSFRPFFVGSSVDGRKVWFETDEALPATGDLDTARDLYERDASGSLTLISKGTANAPATWGGAADDGSRVWFQTAEPVLLADGDDGLDVYERDSTGVVRLVSTSGADIDAHFAGATADGRSVWFSTDEAIPGTGDTDQASDFYERRSAGALRLTSTGGTNDAAVNLRISADGTKQWFETFEAIPGTGDVNLDNDIYERSTVTGLVRLISTGTSALPVVTFHGASPTGARVWFETYQAIPGTGDTDTARDVYERQANGAIRLISGGTANVDARFVRASADGARVVFRTEEAIAGTGDVDTANDLYERQANGALALVSVKGVANVPVTFTGASTDGSLVWFQTTEAVPGMGDADTVTDVYERTASGSLRLVTTGGSTASESFAGAAVDGSRVWFRTTDALPGTGDVDTSTDIDERDAGGAVRLIST